MTPTDEQRRRLSRLLYLAIVEMRLLGWDGRADQCAALADEFHNLPLYLYSDRFDWHVQRQLIAAYCERYPPPQGRFNYITAFDRIRDNAPDPPDDDGSVAPGQSEIPT